MAATTFVPLREKSSSDFPYSKGDVLVVFGELFGKGYVNGIVHEAHKHGMKIIGSTVGRRDPGGELRCLNTEELQAARSIAPFDHFINIPLEAGFDLEKSSCGFSPVDRLKGVRMDEWDQVHLDHDEIEESRKSGHKNFLSRVREYLRVLNPLIPSHANVLFVHTMAGGVPRAKVMMPTMNKVFKGRGDRHISSQRFWESSLGRLCELSFSEVTAKTYKVLIDETETLRGQKSQQGARVTYVAYGYHGCEIWVDGSYRWQTYAPYVQGWAKMELEKVSTDATAKGVYSSVYNCPEILTNSSGLFLGVEVPLYSFLEAMTHEDSGSSETSRLKNHCQNLLKNGLTIQQQVDRLTSYLNHPEIQSLRQFDDFPQHNWQEQMELMLQTSEDIREMEVGTQSEMTLYLSGEIISATGKLMLSESHSPRAPVLWLGHDVLARELLKKPERL